MLEVSLSPSQDKAKCAETHVATHKVRHEVSQAQKGFEEKRRSHLKQVPVEQSDFVYSQLFSGILMAYSFNYISLRSVIKGSYKTSFAHVVFLLSSFLDAVSRDWDAA